MTSYSRQGAKEKAGIMEGEYHGRGYCATSTARHVAEAHNKKNHRLQHVSHDGLIEWDDLLHWQRDNEFILTSHRRASFSFYRSVKSILYLHNESVNIWSHILATVGFAYGLGSLGLCIRCADGSGADEIAVLAYFISVITCFFFSFLHHILLDHSESVRIWTGRLDYLGIVIPLWGTTVASTQFGLRCEHTLRDAYGIFATVASFACAVTTLHPSFAGPSSRTFRTNMYLLLGMSSFTPVVHGIWLFGLQEMEYRMSLTHYFGLGVCHGLGAAMYASRIPERWYLRRCDVWGSSHQIMHLLVVCGAGVYGMGVLKARQNLSGLKCANPP